MAKRIIGAATAAAVVCFAAHAAPPAVGSEDWEVLHPYATWFQSLRRGTVMCCSIADGRPVSARTRGERWQVRWRPGQLDGAPTDWTDVPPDVVMNIPNPVGVPIAFWWGGAIKCFIPAGAI